MVLASKLTSLYLFSKIGCRTHPDPLPPDNVTEIMLLISKSWESMKTFSTWPSTTGSTFAWTPLDGDAIVTVGGFRTSYSSPELSKEIFSIGP